MLTVDRIENGDYSQNEIADLKFRVGIAEDALETAINSLNSESGRDAVIKAAIKVALSRIKSGHNSPTCKVLPVGNTNEYMCECGLFEESNTNGGCPQLTTERESMSQAIDFGEISIAVVETDKREYIWLRMSDGEGMECSMGKIKELLLEFYSENF